MHPPRSSSRIVVTLVVSVVLSLGFIGTTAASPTAPGMSQGPRAAAAPSAPSSPGEEANHRSDEMDLDLVSRTYNPTDDNWTIVAEATLTSNRICIPLVFNCIVGELNTPSNASLESLSCDTHGWNHLLVFRNHCMKQLFFAGNDQKFTFTWSTDPGVSSGTVDLEVEFGRGVLPHTFQQLATAELSVGLGVNLDVNKVCPTEVQPGAALACTITLDYPATPGGGPDISGLDVIDAPDAGLAGLVTAGTLVFTGGDGTWNCSGLTCADGGLSNGQSATFEYRATAVEDPAGGTGVNRVSVSTPGGTISSDDSVVVLGTGDTRLEIEKGTVDTEAEPGGPVTWTVTVTNSGPLPATDVLVSDIPPADVNGLTLTDADGVGTWTCAATTCSSDSMPVGTTTFTAAGIVSSAATGDTTLVNEVGITWANNLLGPDFPITAGSAVPVVASRTTTTIPPPTPGTLPGGDGAPLAITG